MSCQFAFLDSLVRASSHKKRRRGLHVEPLENRKLFAVDVFVQQGILYIDGTNGDDQMLVRFENGQIEVPGAIIKTADGRLVSRIDRAEVPNYVVAVGQAGNDYIHAHEIGNDKALSMIMYGGQGDDTLIGGSAADAIFGMEGVDTIFGEGGDDRLYAALYGNKLDLAQSNEIVERVFGGEGNDQLFGSQGADLLDGDAGRDTLQGLDGDDRLRVGSGDLKLDGGAGADTLEATRLWGAMLSDQRLIATHQRLDGSGALVTATMSIQSFEKAELSADRWSTRGVSLDASGFGGAVVLSGTEGGDVLKGGRGHDTVYAYGGSDQLTGGGGRDKLFGGRGNDRMWGGAGNDRLAGEEGDDVLYGEGDHDELIGGHGADDLHGGSGDDSLVAIDDGYADEMWGNGGRDTFWSDALQYVDWWRNAADNAYTDPMDTVHYVHSFANGADRTLNGDAIADPTDGVNYKNFSHNWLFADRGPTQDDVDQQALGDCWLLAPLAVVAKDSPHQIREIVADFGDGTYGVKLGDKFYRVDGDLPTWNPLSTDQAYAGLGQQNSLWVAVVEKAYAHFRRGDNTYASLGWGDPADALRAYGLTQVAYSYHSAASNDATLAITISVRAYFLQNCVICTGADTGTSGLVASHCYSVVNVSRDANNNVTSIQLRNPWGGDDTGGNPFVTLTPAQLGTSEIWVAWGNA